MLLKRSTSSFRTSATAMSRESGSTLSPGSTMRAAAPSPASPIFSGYAIPSCLYLRLSLFVGGFSCRASGAGGAVGDLDELVAVVEHIVSRPAVDAVGVCCVGAGPKLALGRPPFEVDDLVLFRVPYQGHGVAA